MTRRKATVRTTVTELTGETERRHEDRLATEEPLEIRLAWPGSPAQRVWVTMRTPGHDFELAAGWLVHEGLATAVGGIAYCTDQELTTDEEFNVVTVTLDVPPLREPGHRHDASSSGSSACGVCGKDSIAEALAGTSPSRWAGPLPEPDVVRRLPGLVRAQQPAFERTGGVHAAALATADGDVLVVREDVGRHNAVDKVTGSRVAPRGSPLPRPAWSSAAAPASSWSRRRSRPASAPWWPSERRPASIARCIVARQECIAVL